MAEKTGAKVEISAGCEVIIAKDKFCGMPTAKTYPCMGGGYMALCLEHGRKHTEAWPIAEINCKLV